MSVKHQNLLPATWRHSAPRLRTRLPCCSSAFAPARIHCIAISSSCPTLDPNSKLSGRQPADPDIGWNSRLEQALPLNHAWTTIPAQFSSLEPPTKPLLSLSREPTDPLRLGSESASPQHQNRQGHSSLAAEDRKRAELIEGELAVSTNRTCKFNSRHQSHRYAGRLQPIKHARGADFAGRKATSFEIQLSLLSGVGQQVRHSIDPRRRDFVSTLEGFHNYTSKSEDDKFANRCYRRFAAGGGSVGLPPCGITATPAGGSKSGWHQWQ